MHTSQTSRTIRAAVFAALVVLLAALSQVVLTGRPLPVTVLAVAAVAAFLVAFACAGAERGFGRILAVFLPTELAVNALFDLGQATCTGSDAALHGARPSLESLICGGGSVGGFLTDPGAAMTSVGGLSVLLGHVLLAVLASWWLRQSELALRGQATVTRSLGELLAGAWRVLRPLAPLPARPVLRLVIPRSSRDRIPADPVLLRPAVRRGPPVLAPAC
ncbi:hypothetical protein [Kitasatospora sp. GP82]|uniref:hypothetical protein n=1 Tax=Kitasatospora sp. GP82 TaxID=3035089 RepID=UPI002476A29D|nr:hypothetical protein [Kitasatospora sp. GP82]MDH6123764.1 hypothetical protein [Kitasatospora sp. GP82]